MVFSNCTYYITAIKKDIKSMKVRTKLHGDIPVLTVTGDMMNDARSGKIHTSIKDLIKNNHNKVVVDLGKVTWLASVGLGAILASYSSLKNAGGELKLARSTRKIRSVLIFTQLTKIIKDYDTVEQAIASF
jgi:anti-sigma B factor antagonist